MWKDRLPTSSTRSNNPNFTSEAREERRKKLEKERLEKAQKREQRKKLFQIGVSAPSSPKTSPSKSPKPSLSALIEEDLISLPDVYQSDNQALLYDTTMDEAAITAAKLAAGISDTAPIFHNRCAEDDKEAWKKALTVKFDRNDVEYTFTAVEAQKKIFGHQWSNFEKRCLASNSSRGCD